MSYEHTISDVVKVVEAVGAGIMIFGGLTAFALCARRLLSDPSRPGTYESCAATWAAASCSASRC